MHKYCPNRGVLLNVYVIIYAYTCTCTLILRADEAPTEALWNQDYWNP